MGVVDGIEGEGGEKWGGWPRDQVAIPCVGRIHHPHPRSLALAHDDADEQTDSMGRNGIIFPPLRVS